MEIWKNIPGFERYEACSDGRIRNKSTKKILKQRMYAGYMRVNLVSDSSSKRTQNVHRLITLAFHGLPPNEKYDAAHDDGTRNNNVPNNLSWKTRKENLADRYRHGTMPSRVGEKNSRAVLTEEDVIFIRKSYAEKKHKQTELAAIYGMNVKHISHICCGRRWSKSDPERA